MLRHPSSSAAVFCFILQNPLLERCPWLRAAVQMELGTNSFKRIFSANKPESSLLHARRSSFSCMEGDRDSEINISRKSTSDSVLSGAIGFLLGEKGSTWLTLKRDRVCQNSGCGESRKEETEEEFRHECTGFPAKIPGFFFKNDQPRAQIRFEG